jgi:DNA-binding MarR family transcriptional regulator
MFHEMERPTQSLSHQSCELCVWVAKLAHTVLSGGYAESDTAITLHEARALDALGRKEFWTMSEFAKALSVSLSTASHTADMLVRKRVVKRSKSPLDRRIVLISLSGKGL